MSTSLGIYWQRGNRKLLLLTIAASLVIAQAAFTNYKVLARKANQQQTALSALKRWKAEYEVLLPVQSQWEKTLPPVKNITDIYRLYGALQLHRYGLTTDPERLVIKQPEQVAVNGVPLNATRICISSAGETGLALSAPRFSPDLLSGIDALANRRDVEISNIVLSAANGVPKAVLDLCLVFRNN